MFQENNDTQSSFNDNQENQNNKNNGMNKELREFLVSLFGP